MVLIFTNNQSNFWCREFEAEVISDSNNIYESVSKNIKSGFCPIVELIEYKNELESLPPNSLIALLNADEKYDSKLNSAILKSNVFKAIIRQYEVSNISYYKILSAFFVGLIESSKLFSFDTPRKTVGWCIEGIGMAKRQNRIKKNTKDSGKIIINIPLGYTDFFAETFLDNLKSDEIKDVSKYESLLEIAIQRNTITRKKDHDFVFIGQLGQIVRNYAINALQKFDSKRLIVRNGYGGVSNDENRKLKIGEEYVNGLIESQISVCPPGNISGNSYRIMESLICGSYPAVLSNVLCDPLFESPIIEVLRGRKPLTWYRYLKRLEKVPHGELQQKVVENLYKFKEEINVAKLGIEALQARN